MPRPKHRRESKILNTRVLGGALLAYGAVAVIVIAEIHGPIPTLANARLDAVLPTSEPMPTTTSPPTLPDKTQPDWDDVAPMAMQLPNPITNYAATTIPTTTTTPPTPPTPTTKRSTPSPVPASPKTTTKTAAPQAKSVGGATFRSRFFAIADNYINAGIPYVYGGKTTAGLDCSGFIWTVLKQLSPGQPYRASGSLNTWTTNITKAQAEPGDLVFWPGHVAVYAGNNQVITQGGPGPGPILQIIWDTPTYGRIPL